MTRAFFGALTVGIFIFIALVIGVLFVYPPPWGAEKSQSERIPRVVIPRELQAEDMGSLAEELAREDNISSWVDLEAGETIVSVLSGFFDGDIAEKQFVAYRNLLEAESPIYLTFIDYDETARSYTRRWSAQTAATRPGTISLQVLDLLGDHSVCVTLYGMNGSGEHTLTIFRMNSFRPGENPETDLFSKIAELRIDGNITVREAERSQAYHNGQSRGESFTVSAFGRDYESENMLDQVEITYAYNERNGLYEQRNVTRIPGSQIEQRRVRELLGNPRVFEEFISGLWYFVTPGGTVTNQQFIYLDPAEREIIFYGDGTQQVFNWQNANATRYGLYISSQNVSVSTLKRSIDIELESLDSIRVRVFEDVRLKIGVNAPWDGSYKKTAPLENRVETQSAVNAHIDARFDSSIGKVRFSGDGAYEISSGASVTQGKYAFFNFNDQEMLEFRPAGAAAAGRKVYLIERAEEIPENSLTLLPVRIGAKGMERLREGTITLTAAQE